MTPCSKGFFTTKDTKITKNGKTYILNPYFEPFVSFVVKYPAW